MAHFANLTHVQPLVGLKQGAFQRELQGMQIEPMVFGAGPAVIEAVFASRIDIAYIGPSPAVNGYVRSNGEALRVIAGAVSGGAAFVVRPDSGITGPESMRGKRLGAPQAGNTQDVALRHYLKEHSLKTKEEGGDVWVVNLTNADILTLFTRKELDGAWVPEPWASRLLIEAGGTLLLDERDLWPEGRFPATLVIARKGFLDRHPDVVEKWLRAHIQVTDWVSAHPAEAKALLREELLRLTGASLNPEVVDGAFTRLTVLTDPMQGGIASGGSRAYALGYLDEQPALSHMVDTSFLERASKAPVQ